MCLWHISFSPTISWTVAFLYCAYGVCGEQEVIYFRHGFKALQWDIFIAKINKNSVTFFEAILRNEVTY